MKSWILVLIIIFGDADPLKLEGDVTYDSEDDCVAKTLTDEFKKNVEYLFSNNEDIWLVYPLCKPIKGAET